MTAPGAALGAVLDDIGALIAERDSLAEALFSLAGAYGDVDDAINEHEARMEARKVTP